MNDKVKKSGTKIVIMDGQTICNRMNREEYMNSYSWANMTESYITWKWGSSLGKSFQPL